jgi:hypothetical protein
LAISIPIVEIDCIGSSSESCDGDGGFDAELARRAGFALADALMEGIKFPTALALLLRADLSGASQRPSNHRLKLRLAGNLATDVANEVAEPCAQQAQLPLVALELLAWA